MSDENALLREELDKERQKREELEQKLKADIDLQKEINLLRKKLADMIHETEKKSNIPESPVLITRRGNKESEWEAITDLHIGQLSPSGSSTGRVPNNSGSSCSFEVIEKNSVLHSQGRKESQTSSSGSDSKCSEPGNVKNSEKASSRVPVQSSAEPDSRLTLYPIGREKNSSDVDKVNLSQYVLTKAEGIMEKGDPCEANSCPEQSDPWNGTGARPKNNSFPTNNPKTQNTERNPEFGGQLSSAGTETKEVQNSKMFVQIPKDGGTYRINHLPPINYGQDFSMTGISSIFSSSEAESPTTPKQAISETEPLELNDLNSGIPRSNDKSLIPHLESSNKGDVDKVLVAQPQTKDPQAQEKLLMSFSTPFQSADGKHVAGPPQISSEDGVDLASQLNKLVLEMKSKVLNAEEDLDKFAMFAEDVAKLESRLKEYQAQIQKHQVHSSSLQGHGAEMQRLQMENKELRQLLHVPVQQFDVSSGSEVRWGSVAVSETERKQEEDKALEAKVKDMTALNNQLFSVNKQWEESWKLRESQFTTQREDWDSKLHQLMMENQQLKGQADIVNQLNDELKKSKHEKHVLEQEFKVQESHLLKELKVNRQMKAKYDVYHNATGDMEIKLRDLSEKISELKTNNIVLKEQLTVTMEDFHKEKKHRTMLEDQLKKLKAEKIEQKRNYDTKLKSANLMVKKREEEIFSKDKTIGDFQRMIDDLNAKLRTVERRTVLQPPSLFQSGQPSDVFYPSASPAYNPNQMKVLQEQRELSENPGEYVGLNEGRYKAAASAEHSPSSWACPNCTFINYSETKHCAMCRSAKLTDNSMLQSFSTLHSRDEWPGRDVPDKQEQIDVT